MNVSVCVCVCRVTCWQGTISHLQRSTISSGPCLSVSSHSNLSVSRHLALFCSVLLVSEWMIVLNLFLRPPSVSDKLLVCMSQSAQVTMTTFVTLTWPLTQFSDSAFSDYRFVAWLLRWQKRASEFVDFFCLLVSWASVSVCSLSVFVFIVFPFIKF